MTCACVNACACEKGLELRIISPLLSKKGSMSCIRPSSIVIRVSSAFRVLEETLALDGFFKTQIYILKESREREEMLTSFPAPSSHPRNNSLPRRSRRGNMMAYYLRES